MSKLNKMSQFLPSIYFPTVNTNIRGLLYAWAGEDDKIVEEIQNAKEQLYVKTAQFQYLDALGSNVGVFRPTEFNLADAEYRKLIPALSFSPKQVTPTIKEVLEVFFGENNPQVKVFELNLNEVVIQIPNTVPSLRRGLRGAWHLQCHSGYIVSVDNLAKEIIINLESDTKSLKVDELAGARLGQGLFSEEIMSNTVGTTGVVLQFYAYADLSVFTTDKFMLNVPKYPNSFLHDPTKTFGITSQRGVLGQSITAGNMIATLQMQDSSNIPDTPGYLVFDYGGNKEESRVKYFGRPTNNSVVLDPSYAFLKDHLVGEIVNVVIVPYEKPNIYGYDYSVYYTGILAARELAQTVIEDIVAAGVVVRWEIVEPQI